MIFEEKFMKKICHALIGLFVSACVYMTFLFVLEHFKANNYVYFVSGTFFSVLNTFVLTVFAGDNDEKKEGD
jgi:phosphotransferase system  glucose/maltose/N-acetylglucosamine-specific IIC component